jgi:hypothetical protein
MTNTNPFDLGRADLTFTWCNEHHQPLAACLLHGTDGACLAEQRYVGPSIRGTTSIANQYAANAEPLPPIRKP